MPFKPKPDAERLTRQLHVNLTPPMFEALQDTAARLGEPHTALARRYIEAGIERDRNRDSGG